MSRCKHCSTAAKGPMLQLVSLELAISEWEKNTGQSMASEGLRKRNSVKRILYVIRIF